MLIPTPHFDLTIRGNQTENFDGSWTRMDTFSTSTSKVGSSVTFSGSLSNYVALGDSFSAGQVEPFVPGGRACLRSAYAYPEVYDPSVSFWACSGATIAAVQDTQLGKLERTTKLVTITIGGNDAGLFGALELCLVHVKQCNPRDLTPNFAQLRVRLADLYAQIHARSSRARIFVLGYPNPPPAAIPPDGCEGLRVEGASFLRLWRRDVPFLHGLVTTLDATVRFAVADSRVAKYVSTEGAFAGHDVCSSFSCSSRYRSRT